jgi:ABC-type phosphate transport system substrate-binding protein
VVIVNRENEVIRLSNSELQSIFSGQVSKWENSPAQPIQVWVLPDGDAIRVRFDDEVLPAGTLATNAMLAPDPAAMLEAIGNDSAAIGYLPNLYLSTSDSTLVDAVQIVELPSHLEERLILPVIAITQTEPKGIMLDLLVCLQTQPPD